MRDHLATLAGALRKFLAAQLPALGAEWWNQGVVGNLSYQQRASADEQGWSSIDDLDLSALLRVVDGNWEFCRRRNLVSYEARNWLKEASSVRNRWAHDAPGREPSPDRYYRDLDTLTLLCEAVLPQSDESATLETARLDARRNLTPASSATADTEGMPLYPPAGLAPGQAVRLKSRPEVTGVVTAIAEASPERRITVFHGPATQTYFESQVEVVVASNSEARRQIQGGGLKVNDEPVTSDKASLTAADTGNTGVIKLSLGKKKHVLLKPV